MHSLPFSRIRSLVVSIALLLLVGGIGYRLGEKQAFPAFSSSPILDLGRLRPVVNKTPTEVPSQEPVDFSLFWDVWDKMFRYYIDAATLDSQKMVWGAISGMVNSSGDPYTSFLPPKENDDFKQDIGGEFEGIGAQLGIRDGRIIVVAPLKGSPAQAAGIRAGDYILAVDGEETVGWSVSQAVTKIRGEKETTVRLKILHEGDKDPGEISVIRNTILVPSVEHWIKSIADIEEIRGVSMGTTLSRAKDRVAYIKLSRFGDHTNEDWQKAVSDVVTQEKSVKGLVLDLRNNPGGYLEGSVFIASEFLPSGVVVSQKNSDGSKHDLSVNRKGGLLTIPLVVLVNKGSASAAEIVAGALKDHDRGKVVGEVTFGKGSVQTPYELKGGASVHITTGKWFLPKGDTISEKGITPDLLVPMETPDATADAQLAKAIEELLQ